MPQTETTAAPEDKHQKSSRACPVNAAYCPLNVTNPHLLRYPNCPGDDPACPRQTQPSLFTASPPPTPATANRNSGYRTVRNKLGQRIQARYGRKACDIRCRAAVGNICVCQCRGVNHGVSRLNHHSN